MLKYGLFATVIAALGWFVVDAAKKAAAQFSVRVVAFSTPSLSSGILTVPLVAEVHNPSTLAVNVDRVVADLYILKSNQWIAAGHVDQPISVPAGDSRQVVYAQANLKNIFGGNIFFTAETIAATLSNQLKIKVDVTGSYAGVPIPKQSFTDTVHIS